MVVAPVLSLVPRLPNCDLGGAAECSTSCLHDQVSTSTVPWGSHPCLIGGVALIVKGDSKADPRQAIMALLRNKGQQLHSTLLSALAGRIATDPFAKIKNLIQELIERLLKEAGSEAKCRLAQRQRHGAVGVIDTR